MRPAKRLPGSFILPLPISAIAEQYSLGDSMATIAERFNVAKATINSRLLAAGSCIRPRNGVSYMHVTGNGYLGGTSRDGVSSSIHRACWEASCGPIPTRWVIHHINGEKWDNHIENLMCMPCSMHRRLHAGTL